MAAEMALQGFAQVLDVAGGRRIIGIQPLT